MSVHRHLWYYIREIDGTIRVSTDPLEFGEFYQNPDSRRLRRTQVGDADVSTVFLGFDHRLIGAGEPILFETMIFGGDHDCYQERYETEAQAVAGHRRIVEWLTGQSEQGA